MNRSVFLIERGIITEDGEINTACIYANAVKEAVEFATMIVDGKQYTLQEIVTILECVERHNSSLLMHSFVQAVVMRHEPHMELGFFYDVMECEEAADFYVSVFMDGLRLLEEVTTCITRIMELRKKRDYECRIVKKEKDDTNLDKAEKETCQ